MRAILVLLTRVHQTLNVTPAMEAGLTDHVWTIEELVNLIGSATGILGSLAVQSRFC
jgi:hypothetical protein